MGPYPGFAAALTAAARADAAPRSSSTEASAQQCARDKAEGGKLAGAPSAVESVEIAETPVEAAAAAAETATGGTGERARTGSDKANTESAVSHTEQGAFAGVGMGAQADARLAQGDERVRDGETGEDEDEEEEEWEEQQQRPLCVVGEEGEGVMEADAEEQRSARKAGVWRGEVLEVAVRRGLVEQVQRKLRKAVESPSQRAGVLRQLFTDIAFELDGHAHDVLLRDPSASLSSLCAAAHPALAPAFSATAVLAPFPGAATAPDSRLLLLPQEKQQHGAAQGEDQGNKPWHHQQQQQQEGLRGVAAGGECERVCFYEVLAQHYAESEASVAALLPLFAPLWSCVFSSQIFALLLHRWLYSSPKPHSEEVHRYTRAFMTGVEGIFWIDLQSNEQRFCPLFNFVMERIVMDEQRFALVPPLFQKDMFCTVARCFFLYQSGTRLPALLAAASRQEALHGATADIFVTELTNQLQRIKVEPVLLLFLHRCTALKGLDLRSATAIRLQVALHSMAVPGGPLFPTRPVRQAARSALDTLYPVGRMFRHMISFSFRILHPLYWPTSLIPQEQGQGQGQGQRSVRQQQRRVSAHED
ncbi:unnamed protein product [Closterium sp. NIES-64]|nr:unnamed protein product [Closterium sp. NIES-64]